MTSEKRGITFAGEYILDEFSILKADSDLALDIRNQLSGLFIYEDMFSPFISGTAVIRDTLDLLNIYGRGGKNLVRIKITTPGIGKMEGYFHLYKISDRSKVADRTAVYTLNFVSQESLVDTSLHISKRFSGSPNEIAEIMYKKYLKTDKKVITSQTSNRTVYVSNYWSAVENLAFLSDNSLSDKNTADFFAFENRDGFNFTSMETVIRQDPIQEFEKSDYVMTVVRPNDGSVVRDINREYRQIQEISVSKVYDFMTDADSGAIRNRMLFHDITRKQYTVQDFEQSSDNKTLLNKNRLYTDNIIQSMRTKIIPARKQFALFENSDLSNARFLSKRVMHVSMLQGQKIEIDVMGRLDYTVGKKVHVNLNQLKNITKDMSEDEIQDKILSGFYIVTAILHRFDGKSHSCKLELMKDSTLSS